jgi:hypothetical protein
MVPDLQAKLAGEFWEDFELGERFLDACGYRCRFRIT